MSADATRYRWRRELLEVRGISSIDFSSEIFKGCGAMRQRLKKEIGEVAGLLYFIQQIDNIGHFYRY
jgi:hypothetical protein